MCKDNFEETSPSITLLNKMPDRMQSIEALSLLLNKHLSNVCDDTFEFNFFLMC